MNDIDTMKMFFEENKETVKMNKTIAFENRVMHLLNQNLNSDYFHVSGVKVIGCVRYVSFENDFLRIDYKLLNKPLWLYVKLEDETMDLPFNQLTKLLMPIFKDSIHELMYLRGDLNQ